MTTRYGMDEDYEDAQLMHLRDIDQAIRRLGLNDAATSMGAIELLAKEVHDGSHAIASALADVAAAIRDTTGDVDR